MKRLSDLSKFIRIIILNSRFDNVIDLHYLLNQIHRIETVLIPRAIKDEPEISSLAEVIGDDEDLPSQIDNLE